MVWILRNLYASLGIYMYSNWSQRTLCIQIGPKGPYAVQCGTVRLMLDRTTRLVTFFTVIVHVSVCTCELCTHLGERDMYVVFQVYLYFFVWLQESGLHV